MSKKNRYLNYKIKTPTSEYSALVSELKRKTVYQLFKETNTKRDDFYGFYLNILLPFLEFKFKPKDANSGMNWLPNGEVEKIREIEDALQYLFNSYKSSNPDRWDLF